MPQDKWTNATGTFALSDEAPPKPAITDFTAVGVVEGWLDSESEEEVIASWQHLINTGLAWRLQGWFGRTAHALITAGVCQTNATQQPR